jgi:death-on-curing protein
MKFLNNDRVLFMHRTMLERYGGEAGFLNETSLDSALAAPINRHGYDGAGLAECAATYAFHVTKAHAFVDGNKRVGGAAALAFLELNGATLDATVSERHDLILDIAAGRITRDEVDAWFTARVRDAPA